jgi:hypothetical protein
VLAQPPLPPALAAVAAGPCLKGGGAPVRRSGGRGGTRGGGLGHGREGTLASAAMSGGAPLRLCGQRRGRRLMGVLLAWGGFRCILALGALMRSGSLEFGMNGLMEGTATTSFYLRMMVGTP